MATGYGHEYTPEKLETHVALSADALAHSDIKFIRLTWVDLTNTVRLRVIPVKQFLKIISSPRPAISMIAAAPGLVFNSTSPGFGSKGELIYVPDMSSLRTLAYAPGHAGVFGWFESKDHSSGPLGLCPRGLLRRVIEQASDSGVRYLVGFETEFILLKKTGDKSIQAVNDHPWSATRALLSGSPEAACLEEIALVLQDCGIQVEMLHAEAAPGQYEIVTGPLSPLEAADALIVTRDAILNVANKHGLWATFAPRVFPDDCGSACHTHISVHRTAPSAESSTASSDIFARPDHLPEHLSTAEASFLSGVLSHLPAICAVTLPTSASYARVADGVWSGGTYVSWGRDTRETPMRICGSPKTGSGHFEFRPLDGTANPYVALAAILGAGSIGVKESQPLDIQPSDAVTPAEMDDDARKKLGIVDRLPLALVDARSRFQQDTVMKELLGDIGDVWTGVNETFEQALEAKAKQNGGNMNRVMIENF